MLLDAPSEPRVSTGLEALDEVLGGLYWGDNVVWQLDRAPVEPFYKAIASSDAFDSKTVVSIGAAVNTYGVPGLGVIDAGAPADRQHGADMGRGGHARLLRPLLSVAARGRRDRLLDDERA